MMEENIFGHAAVYWEAALAWLLSVVNKTSQKKRGASELHRFVDTFQNPV